MKTFGWTFPEPPLSPVEKLRHREARLARGAKVVINDNDLKFLKKWSAARKLGLKKYTIKQLTYTALLFIVVSLFIFLLGYKEFAVSYFIGGTLGGFIGIPSGTKSKWKKNEERFEIIQSLSNQKLT